MSITLVCGAPGTRFQTVYKLLAAQGVQAPNTPEGKPHCAPGAMLDRLEQDHAFKQPIQPGKAWEMAAGELFLANWGQPHWGWADSRNIWLLDFWSQFEPGIQFLLIHDDPRQVVAQSLTGQGEASPIESDLGLWATHEQEMLRFFHRHRDRCQLVEAAHILQEPRAFIREIRPWIGITDTASGQAQTWVEDIRTPGTLDQWLSTQVLNAHPELQVLQQEANACLTWTPARIRPVDTETQMSPHALEQPIKALVAERQHQHRLRQQLDLTRSQMETEKTEHESWLKAQNERLAAKATQLAELKKEKADLTAARDQQSKLAGEHQAQLDTLQTQFTQQASKLKELEEEGELLLLQLHQVQEELERYFLESQSLRSEKAELEGQWQRFLDRHPDWLDWQTLSLVSDPDTGHSGPLTWRIEGLQTAYRTLPDITVTLAAPHGQPALIYPRDEALKTSGPLQRWPEIAHDQATLTIQPTGPAADQAQRLRSIAALSTGDWHLTQALVRLLSSPEAKARAQVAGLGVTEQTRAQQWLDSLRKGLETCPPVFRYGQVRIKQALADEVHEQLWFELTDVEWSEHRWKRFEFRFGAHHLLPGQFSAHPKLEFPEVAGQPHQFERWFAESTDPHGDKFELRFDQTVPMLDRGVWAQLSPGDQAQLFMIAALLPEMIKAAADMPPLQRPLEDWVTLAKGVAQTLREQLQADAATATPAPVQPTPAAAKGSQRTRRTPA